LSTPLKQATQFNLPQSVRLCWFVEQLLPHKLMWGGDDEEFNGFTPMSAIPKLFMQAS
jgi:hypothetical protein